VTRDNDRSQVYAAEDACLAGTAFAESPGPTVLSAALNDAFTSRWWRSAVGEPARITFADNLGSGFYRHADRRIHLGRTARWLVAAHELAHMAAAHDRVRPPGAPAHDDRFCGWEVVVFGALFGTAASDLLAAGFRSFGITATMPPAAGVLDEPLWQRYVQRVERRGWRPPPIVIDDGSAATATPIPLG
jgi:hypothetical protein